MIRRQYKCTLLSDVVISSSAATEGFQASLNYIPGSKFLGIVAKSLYGKKIKVATDLLNLFHNGHVRFGDAHPYIDEQRMEVLPYAWQFPKGKKAEGIYYQQHQANFQDIKKELVKDSIQLKQARGYYFQANRSLKLGQKFSIKSAYNRAERRSKDGQMFGYNALKSGTEWSFIIEMESDQYQEDIDMILGNKKEHRIGRSKTAQYGLIKIEFLKDLTKDKKETESDILAGEIHVYAASNLCFYDESGQTTLKPSITDLLPLAPAAITEEDAIIWEKSNIRSRTYRTWNKHRQNRDTDRMIIEKGSVFVLKTTQKINKSIFDNGIGQHKSEGFGRVLVNPDFLQVNEEKQAVGIQKYKEKELPKPERSYIQPTGTEDAQILTFLKKKAIRQDAELQFSEKINDFIKKRGKLKDFEGISSSQWGQIRRFAKLAGNANSLQYLLFDQVIGFCFRGQSKKKWGQKKRTDTLYKAIFNDGIPTKQTMDFTIKLAAEMAKASS